MTKYTFLSDQWLAEARRIHDEHGAKPEGPGDGAAGPPSPRAVRMNQVITEVPFGVGTIKAHLDTASGGIEIGEGHIEGAEATVTIDYATARQIFVDGNPQAGMVAFMAGKIKVEGDPTRLLALQGGIAVDERAARIAELIREMTK